MINKIKTATIIGIKGNYVEVEVVISNGIPSFTIVGLVDATVKEAKERVRGAIINSGFRYPNRRITMNLSPADIRKNGTHFDLPLAISLLRSSRQIGGYQNLIDEYAFIGELSLSGEIKPVTGILPMVMSLYEVGIKKVFVPWGNRMEASLVKGIQVFAAKDLGEIVNHLEQKQKIEPNKNEYHFDRCDEFELDYSQVRGQEAAKRAISIAAAGSHGLLMVGSPSSGKTMLSKRIPSILPPMEYQDIIESTNIYSILGKRSEREVHLLKSYDAKETEYKSLLDKVQTNKAHALETGLFIDTLKKLKPDNRFSETMWGLLLSEVEVYNKDDIRYVFKDGSIVKVSLDQAC